MPPGLCIPNSNHRTRKRYPNSDDRVTSTSRDNRLAQSGPTGQFVQTGGDGIGMGKRMTEVCVTTGKKG
jgi:hypothetical protein